jgi:hypothetical protein
MIGEGDCGAICGMKIGRGNWSTRSKLAPVPLCPPQIPLDRTRDPTRGATVGSQRLTAWAMARISCTILPSGVPSQIANDFIFHMLSMCLANQLHFITLIKATNYANHDVVLYVATPISLVGDTIHYAEYNASICEVEYWPPWISQILYTVTILSDHWRGFRLETGFIEYLNVVTTSNYHTIANVHTLQMTSLFSLLSLVVPR